MVSTAALVLLATSTSIREHSVQTTFVQVMSGMRSLSTAKEVVFNKLFIILIPKCE